MDFTDALHLVIRHGVFGPSTLNLWPARQKQGATEQRLLGVSSLRPLHDLSVSPLRSFKVTLLGTRSHDLSSLTIQMSKDREALSSQSDPSVSRLWLLAKG